MQRSRRTKPGTRKLSEVAKLLVLPTGIVSSGWPSVRDTCERMGIVHDEWQVGLGRAILAKRSSGLYAAGIGGVIISICRQVGKTFTIASIIFALCILFPGMKVLWSAHRARTSDETFTWMQKFTRKRRIAPYILAARAGNGKQEVLFRNGSKIMFGAREHGFGRGFDDVDAVVYDEAQILTEKALDDMVPATNAAKNPLILYLGTPPKPNDPSEVFTSRRHQAKKGTLENAVYVEVGAEPDADLDDRDQWMKANPSFPHRTREDAILRMKANLGDDSFRREGLGIWDEDRDQQGDLDMAKWNDLAVDGPLDHRLKAIGVAFDSAGMRMSVGGCVFDGDRAHVEQIATYTGAVEGGLGQLADWLVERDQEGVPRWKRTAGIVISGRAGSLVLAQLLRERRVPEKWIILPTTGQYLQACGLLDDMITTGTVTHLGEGQDDLEQSVQTAVREKRQGGWAWGGPNQTPIESVSLALWGTRTSPLRSRFTGRTRKAVNL